MATHYPPHVCALPGCDVITTNYKYCRRSHAQRHNGDLRIAAREAAEAAAREKHLDELVMRRAIDHRDPVMVDARGRWPAITLDMIDLGGLPGTSVQAYPWPAP